MTERSRSQGRGKENCFSPSLAEPVEAREKERNFSPFRVGERKI